MPRTKSHGTETESRLIFESAITRYADVDVQQGDLLFRAITERDYGIDGQVELFSHGEPTGRIAMIQLKGTKHSIEQLKTEDAVSCSRISKSNLCYCRQKNVPVMLVYCSTEDNEFYYIDLQSVYKEKIDKLGDRQTCTVRIPVGNNSENLEHFVHIVNNYYEMR